MNKSVRQNKFGLLLIFFSFVLITFGHIFYEPLDHLYNKNNHIFVHSLLEIFSIIVCFSIALYGWQAFYDRKTISFLVLPFIFGAVGILDFFHFMTYPGMPFFITESSLEKTGWFWIAARVTSSIGLCYLILVEGKVTKITSRIIPMVVSCCYLIVTITFIYVFEKELPTLINPGAGPTLTKNILEYMISSIFLFVLIVVFTKFKQTGKQHYLELIIASSLLVMGELALTIYNNISDIQVVIGHIIKAFGYGYILKAYFFSRLRLTFSQKHETEKNLIYTQGLLESFFSHTPDSITIMDKNGKILAVNEGFEQVYGWKKDEVVGLLFRHIMQDVQEDIDKVVNHVSNGKSLIAYDTIRQRKDGTKININMTISPIKNEHGDFVSIAAISRDITKLKKTEDLLRKSDKLAVVGELAAGIAHEIRNPLTTLKGFTKLLEAENELKKKEYLSIIQSELDRIEFITNEFMAVAKPQVILFKESNVITLIKQVITFYRPQMLLKNIQVMEHYESNEAIVYCDENQIKQVFINLIKNAIEAMPNGGAIKILVSQQNDSFEIKIEDSGEGIPKEILPRIGEPFYTLKEKGTGLGLMVTFRIISSHQGTISFESEEKIGTTITINIPTYVREVIS